VQVDQVNAALVQALAAKGVVAKVEHETIEPTLEHPLRAMEFRVVSPRPVVANIKLAGATPNLVPLLQSSVNTTAHTPYNAGLSGRLTAESILAPLLDAGYIDAALGSVTLEAGALDKSLGLEPVVVNAKLSPGDVYHLSSITFAGSPLMTADAFNAGAKLHLGDTASRMQLLLTLAPLDTAYRKQGYMDVIIKADPKEDAAAHTVAYTVTVTPGEQYRLAKVTAEGLDPTAQADFEKYFKLRGHVHQEQHRAQESGHVHRNLQSLRGSQQAHGGAGAEVLRRTDDHGALRVNRSYSHSIVPGGFEVMS
jgi:outer membrane protein insertion porin family